MTTAYIQTEDTNDEKDEDANKTANPSAESTVLLSSNSQKGEFIAIAKKDDCDKKHKKKKNIEKGSAADEEEGPEFNLASTKKVAKGSAADEEEGPEFNLASTLAKEDAKNNFRRLAMSIANSLDMRLVKVAHRK
jgi:hypothetical protein